MRQAIEETGIWWFPTSPDRQEAGTMTFDQDSGVQLELIGALNDYPSMSVADPSDRATMQGWSKKAKPVTLLKAFTSSHQLNLPGFAVEKFKANVALIGVHCKSAEEPISSQSDCRFDGIERWTGRSGMVEAYDFESQQHSLTLVRMPATEAGRCADFTVRVCHDGRTKKIDDTSWRATSQTWLSIENLTDQSLDWHFQATARLRELATLCFGCDLQFFDLRLRLPKNEQGFPQEATVYAQLVGATAKRIGDRQPIITLDELLRDNADAVSAWFELSGEIEEARGLLFSSIGDSWMYTSSRFLIAAQAIEVYARRTQPHTLVPTAACKPVHTALVQAIPENIDDRLRKSLMDKLAFANEPSLRERLNTCAADLRLAFGEIDSPFDDAWVGSIVATRNYLTHYSANLKKKALSGSDLYWETRRLQLFLMILMLLQVGVKASTIVAGLNRNDELRRLWSEKGALT